MQPGCAGRPRFLLHKPFAKRECKVKNWKLLSLALALICLGFLFIASSCGDDDDDSGESPMDCETFCNNEDYVQIAMDCGLLNATTIEDGILECLTQCEGQGIEAEVEACFTAFTDCETLLECIPGEQ